MTFRFSRHATVELADGDTRAIGGAVTMALCGHWDHSGPCRWPHLTTVESSGGTHAVTVHYTCSDNDRMEVEALIERALGSGELAGPDGAVTKWKTLLR